MDYGPALREEIFDLLKQAKDNDPEFRLFGADEHHYELNPPMDPSSLREIEQKYAITLPEDYFWFMTEVADGGAGPYYGILPLHRGSGKQQTDFSRYETAKNEPLDLPIDATTWADMVARLEEGANDDNYWSVYDPLFDGMVQIATQGCTYDCMLMVKGKDRGRVVYIDEEACGPSSFPPEANASFLDWYMGWLRECAACYQIDEFGYGTLGSPDEIMAAYRQSDEKDRLVRLGSVKKARKEDRYLPKQGPGLSNAVKAQVIDIYRNDEFPACRMAALDAMIYFEIPGWEEAVKNELPRVEYVNRLSQALEKKYRRVIYQYDPRIDQWYDALVAALPAAAQASTDMKQKFAFGCVASMAACCRSFRFEDLLGFAEGPTRYTTLDILSHAGSIPKKYWPVFFSFIDESIDAFLAAPRSHQTMNGLRNALFMLRGLLGKTPKSKRSIRTLYSPRLAALAQSFADDPPSKDDEFIPHNVALVQNLL